MIIIIVDCIIMMKFRVQIVNKRTVVDIQGSHSFQQRESLILYVTVVDYQEDMNKIVYLVLLFILLFTYF